MLKTITERVTVWANDRKINEQAPNKIGYVANKAFEIGEYCKGIYVDRNENDYIDAIADSMIFDLTELLKFGCDLQRTLYDAIIFDYLGEMKYEVEKTIILDDYDIAYKNGQDVIAVIIKSLAVDWIELVISGYDPCKVLDEVLKVIESRSGEWNDETNKFEKDTSPEAQARWYKSDYVTNCKLI